MSSASKDGPAGVDRNWSEELDLHQEQIRKVPKKRLVSLLALLGLGAFFGMILGFSRGGIGEDPYLVAIYTGLASSFVTGFTVYILQKIESDRQHHELCRAIAASHIDHHQHRVALADQLHRTQVSAEQPSGAEDRSASLAEPENLSYWRRLRDWLGDFPRKLARASLTGADAAQPRDTGRTVDMPEAPPSLDLAASTKVPLARLNPCDWRMAISHVRAVRRSPR